MVCLTLAKIKDYTVFIHKTIFTRECIEISYSIHFETHNNNIIQPDIATLRHDQKQFYKKVISIHKIEYNMEILIEL